MLPFVALAIIPGAKCRLLNFFFLDKAEKNKKKRKEKLQTFMTFDSFNASYVPCSLYAGDDIKHPRE